jgi:hypothetical protein
MTVQDPSKRPSLDQARLTMNTHFAGLAGWRMRWPILPSDASFRERCIYFVAGLTTEVVLVLRAVMRLLLLRPI